MLGVLLLFKISRNLIKFKPCERIFFSIRIVFSEEMFQFIKCPLGAVCKLGKYIN